MVKKYSPLEMMIFQKTKKELYTATMKKSIKIGGVIGATIGLIGGAYLANETVNWIDAETPNLIKYTLGGVGALIGRNYVGKLGLNIGLACGVAYIQTAEQELKKMIEED